MSKNILIIDSSLNNNQPLTNLFAELKLKNYSFYLLSKTTSLYNQFKQNNWPAKKIYLGPNLNNKFNSLLFIILLPILLLTHFLVLIYLIYRKKITTIICLNWNEKVIFTLLAKILNLKTIWLELPGINYQAKNILLLFYKLFYKWTTIVAFTSLDKIGLKKLGLNENNIKIILPGVKLNKFERQDTIFDKLAQANKGNFHRKYFTIGTIADLNQEQRIETLFQAAKIFLNIIPNLQIIIVGDGKERKNLTWLAKKMEIDNLVWFVGESKSPGQNRQAYLKKWLDSFDLFVVINETLGLADLNLCLYIMAAGLPIIGPSNLGLEDIVKQDQFALDDTSTNQSGILIEKYDKEMLARQIIKLQQNKRLRLELAKNAKIRVNKFFTIDKMVEKFESIL